MVQAARELAVFPESSGHLRHLREEIAAFRQHLGAVAVVHEQLQPQIVADNGVGAVDRRIDYGVVALRTEFREHCLKQRGIRFPGRNAEVERVVLARLGGVTGFLELAVRVPDCVVLKEFAVPGLFADHSTHLCRPFAQCVVAVQLCHSIQCSSPEHVRRIVHARDEVLIVAAAPFDEYPAFQIFKQSVCVHVAIEKFYQTVDLIARQDSHLVVSGAVHVIAQLQKVPHRPVRNVNAVVVVGRIAHRDHSGGQERRLRTHCVVFEEILFDTVFSGEQCLRAGREITVAEPAGAFPGRTVGQHIHGILGKRIYSGGDDLIQLCIVIVVLEMLGIRILIGNHTEGVYFQIPCRRHHIGIPCRVGFHGEKVVFARCKRVLQHVAAGVAERIDGGVSIPCKDQLIEENIDDGRLFHRHIEGEKAGDGA